LFRSRIRNGRRRSHLLSVVFHKTHPFSLRLSFCYM
jgi:hypothetical protein